jgi:hypothetical protein
MILVHLMMAQLNTNTDAVQENGTWGKRQNRWFRQGWRLCYLWL